MAGEFVVSMPTLRPELGTTEMWGWCFGCAALQPFATPLPALQVRNGTSLREGTCAVCSGPLWRVGGAKEA